MIRTALFALILGAGATPAAAQIAYDIAFPNAAHHEAKVTLTVTGAPRTALFRMAASSPGRYALTGFAKNVYDVTATDGRGRELTVTQTDPEGWSVAGHDGTVTLKYTVYGDRSDGTYLQVDPSHAHLNMPATFLFVRGLDARPIRVRFNLPEGSGWKVATQLLPTDDPSTFTAPNLQYFMDSPTELSDFTLREWTVTSGGRTQTIRLALHHAGTETEADSFAAMARRVVEQQIAVFGETPAYEPGTYTFIADYLPWASGDGMEHRNSTILSSSGSLASNTQGLLTTLSHEYFHSWNMERIRARALEPFDFTRANMSEELWAGEGFTQYYGGLFVRRSGVGTLAGFVRGLGFTVNAVVNSPGRRFFGPAGMSRQAPWRDGATSLDPSNADNVFISYYTYGNALALALDLSLRQRDGKSMDGYMRALWLAHGKPETPYTIADLERTLAIYSGDRALATDFFTRHVRGREVPDFAALLAGAGLLLRRASAGTPFLGPDRFTYDARGAVLQSNTLIGTPLYEAGLDRGDRIVSLDGRPLTADSVLSGVRAAHRPADVIPVEFESRGRRVSGRITVGEDPRLEVVLNEEAGLPVSPAMLALRRNWLGTER